MASKKVKKPVDPDVAHGKAMRKLVDDFADNLGDDKMLVADGFDAAIIGITEACEPVVVYDWDKCVELLRKDMPEEDAIEHMSFNVTGAYVGPRTPLFIRLLNP
jgi:hypothetical protein